MHHRYLESRSRRDFSTSGDYWERRYVTGGTSGDGSYGQLARFKAAVLNDFVSEHRIRDVLELGVGDGNQLGLAEYPQYRGLDVSAEAIRMCRARFENDRTKQFGLLADFDDQPAELTLSLDVVYHLVEDDVFDAHMRLLFGASTRYVAVYASNYDSVESAIHVRHREFTRWVGENCPEWVLDHHLANPYAYDPRDHSGSLADFYFYRRAGTQSLQDN
ncbi:class I SAM-dependent methyltransferase [Planctomonas sp. JC2975]|nr:class I SAM-dependent methyltransferase [Planctomonas sp. JC2975]